MVCRIAARYHWCAVRGFSVPSLAEFGSQPTTIRLDEGIASARATAATAAVPAQMILRQTVDAVGAAAAFRSRRIFERRLIPLRRLFSQCPFDDRKNRPGQVRHKLCQPTRRTAHEFSDCRKVRVAIEGTGTR